MSPELGKAFASPLSVLRWGDVPTWVGSVGTVSALAFGVVTLRAELHRRRDEREAARRGQANLLTAWTDMLSAGEIDDTRGNNLKDDQVYKTVVLANNSDRAVYEVFWKLWDRETECRMDTGYMRALPPHRECAVIVPGPFGGDPEVHLNFVDAGGIMWFRTDRILSVGEWWDHPDREKWNDHEREWTRVWPEAIVRTLKAQGL